MNRTCHLIFVLECSMYKHRQDEDLTRFQINLNLSEAHSRSMVHILFGTRDQFLGRQFFPWMGSGLFSGGMRAGGMAGEASLASLPVHRSPHAELEESKTRAVHCLLSATPLLVNSVLTRIEVYKPLAANLSGSSDRLSYHPTHQRPCYFTASWDLQWGAGI